MRARCRIACVYLIEKEKDITAHVHVLFKVAVQVLYDLRGGVHETTPKRTPSTCNVKHTWKDRAEQFESRRESRR